MTMMWHHVWSLATGRNDVDRDADVVTIEQMYRQPWRAYHNTRHMEDVIANIHTILHHGRIYPRNPRALFLAAIYHDIIYVPGQKGSEDASALLLGQCDYPEQVRNEAMRLIRLTAHHQPEWDDPDGAILCDADLWGLGSALYMDNSIAIRTEIEQYLGFTGGLPFTHAFDTTWRSGRTKWLQEFLDRPWIYYTSAGMTQFEDRARENLRAERDYLMSINAVQEQTDAGSTVRGTSTDTRHSGQSADRFGSGES